MLYQPIIKLVDIGYKPSYVILGFLQSYLIIIWPLSLSKQIGQFSQVRKESVKPYFQKWGGVENPQNHIITEHELQFLRVHLLVLHVAEAHRQHRISRRSHISELVVSMLGRSAVSGSSGAVQNYASLGRNSPVGAFSLNVMYLFIDNNHKNLWAFMSLTPVIKDNI